MTAELTDEQIAEEEKFLEGLPRMNWGAFFMPGIWGPAHGFWICILFYPLYVFIDYLLYGAYIEPEAWKVILAAVSFVLLLALHVAFAIVSQPMAAHRAADRGVARETYLKRQRIWAVVCFAIAVIGILWATYYNLDVRTVLK